MTLLDARKSSILVVLFPALLVKNHLIFWAGVNITSISDSV